MAIGRIAILGTGLIGASVGLALRSQGFRGEIVGWDKSASELGQALDRGAVTVASDDPFQAARAADVTVLAGPVLTILDWLTQLAPGLTDNQLVTDVGSVKQALCERARGLYNGPGLPGFLPGHPMAGKEVSGAANADGGLFAGAVWLFTECGAMAAGARALAAEWRGWTAQFGCRLLDMDAARHDDLCAWVSHLPQFVSTALAALLEELFAGDAELRAVGGRALGEMTRLGASPFSMWRDIAHTNEPAIARALLALEQRLVHVRENLRTPELREEFARANRFRLARTKPSLL